MGRDDGSNFKVEVVHPCHIPRWSRRRARLPHGHHAYDALSIGIEADAVIARQTLRIHAKQHPMRCYMLC